MAYLPFTNTDLISPSLAGRTDYGFDGSILFDVNNQSDETKKVETEEDTPKVIDPFQQFIIDSYKDAQEEKEYYRSDEYLDKMYQRADDLQARQMARAQKYGKESAMYGFFYQGLPSLMAQAAFSRYAFAPEAVKGVQDAYRRINLAQAVKPQGGQSYMSVNPMG